MRLDETNHWWAEKTVREELSPPKKRLLFKTLYEGLFRRQVQVVDGLRRVGKSTLVYQLIKKLLEERTNPLRILYITFDDPEVRKLGIVGSLKEYTLLTKEDYRRGRLFLFVDEAQKYPEWVSEVKLLYDNYPNIRIVATGSAGLNLLAEAKRTLAGRTVYHELKPLNLKEFLMLREIDADLSKPLLYEDKLKQEFNSFLKRPFPEIVNEPDESFIRNYVSNAVIEPVLFRDIPREFMDVDVLLVERLVETFFASPGQYLSVDSLASDLRRAKTTIYKSLFYLEASFLTRRVMNFRPSVRSASRKLSRIYAYHPVLTLPYRPSEEKYVENFVMSELNARYYWRENGKEVDFLVDLTPVEVKYVDVVRKEEIKPLRFFMDKY
ncbi:MAG: ATP-binding protein, partial [Candidatus Caldarchaeum sp.]|nr:ATP-binding protein [Candidatus Caldarchaeum sp.]MDW8434756.1 ATP-binding protein [Candidatus Caldarchaeum sp.]